jgi:HAD superfamily hydrolase (TIGR01509 family)
LQVLLFDLDGTLVHTDEMHFKVWQDLLQPFGLTIDRPFYQAHFSGRTNAAILHDLLPQLSIEQATQLSWQKEAEFRRQAASKLKPMPGLLERLAWADAQGLKQAVVTNAPAENAEFMLQTLGLANQLDTLVLAEQLPCSKPDPLAYCVALERLGVEANAAIAFEDSPSGITAAVGAGIFTVGIASTHAPERLYAVGASLVVADFADRVLDELLQAQNSGNLI